MTALMTALARAIAIGALAVAVGGCAATELPAETFLGASVGPASTVTPAVSQTRLELVRVLAEHDLVLTDSQAAVRPAETTLLAAAPRALYQVILPKDPLKGFIVVYEFLDAGRAATAAAEEAAWLGTGPGRVQTPQGTVTMIRQVGSTIVLYSWLPGASLDPSADGIQAALEGLGVEIPVAN